MNFPELCRRLKCEKGVANVWCDRYPDDGTPDGSYILRIENDRYCVGAVDDNRGTWVSMGSFDDEEAACKLLYKRATWVALAPVLVHDTPEETAWRKFTTDVRVRSYDEEIPSKRLLVREIESGRAPTMPERYQKEVWEPYQQSLNQDD